MNWPPDFYKNASSLFLDSSSTAGAMIPHFSNFSDLTVITNGLRNALLLAENPDLRVIIACGTVRPNSGSLYGADTLNYLSGLNPGYCFISCGGLSGSGITESTFEQGAIKRQMLHGAENGSCSAIPASLRKNAFIVSADWMRWIFWSATSSPLPS